MHAKPLALSFQCSGSVGSMVVVRLYCQVWTDKLGPTEQTRNRQVWRGSSESVHKRAVSSCKRRNIPARMASPKTGKGQNQQKVGKGKGIKNSRLNRSHGNKLGRNSRKQNTKPPRKILTSDTDNLMMTHWGKEAFIHWRGDKEAQVKTTDNHRESRHLKWNTILHCRINTTLLLIVYKNKWVNFVSHVAAWHSFCVYQKVFLQKPDVNISYITVIVSLYNILILIFIPTQLLFSCYLHFSTWYNTIRTSVGVKNVITWVEKSVCGLGLLWICVINLNKESIQWSYWAHKHILTLLLANLQLIFIQSLDVLNASTIRRLTIYSIWTHYTLAVVEWKNVLTYSWTFWNSPFCFLLTHSHNSTLPVTSTPG